MAIKFGYGHSLQASSGNIVTMVAKFSSVCHCGALIEPGDAMSYDTLNRKSLCYVCVKRLSEFGTSDQSTSASIKGTNGAFDDNNEKCYAEFAPNNQANYTTGGTSQNDAGKSSKRVELPARNVAEVKCQSLIQRFRELRGATQLTREERKQEMTEILKCFKTEFTSSAIVHTFILEIAKCKHRGADYRALKTRFHGACIHCGAVNEAGELALYDHHTRRIHCLFCDCLRGM